MSEFLRFDGVSREDTAWRVARLLAYMRVTMRMTSREIDAALAKDGPAARRSLAVGEPQRLALPREKLKK